MLPRMLAVKVDTVQPFNAVCPTKSTKRSGGGHEDENSGGRSENEDRWDPGFMALLHEKLALRYSRQKAASLFERIRAKADEFLSGASTFNVRAHAAGRPEGKQDDDDEMDDDDGDGDGGGGSVPREGSTGDGEEEVDLLQFAHRGPGIRRPENETVVAGCWIQYQHRVRHVFVAI